MKINYIKTFRRIGLLIFSAASLHSTCCDAAQVVAWGDNSYGQTNVPPDLTNAISISAGQNFSLALRADGTVAAWGDNSSGQASVPEDLSNVVAVAAGGYHALALRSDGTVVAWGAGMSDAEVAPDFGQGIVPPDLTNVVAIAGGLYHSMALRADGSVVAWGDNSRSQTNVPLTLSNAVAIAAGDYHSVAMSATQNLIAWGDNSAGQTNVPINLSFPWFSLAYFREIAAGSSHSLLLGNGGIVSWGSQKNGPVHPFGYGTIINSSAGTTLASVSKVSAQSGNVVINGGPYGPMIVYGGPNGLAVSANSQINYNTNYLNLPASAYSGLNWNTANQIPYNAPNPLYNFNRFIAVADLTPNGYSTNTHNNHFTNLLSFINAANVHSNSAHAMEGVIVVDISLTDKNIFNITDKNIPNGVNVKGTLLLNFTGAGWDPTSEKVIVTAALNINPANLSGLVATNPATYTSGYPPIYTDPTKSPTNIDISSIGFTNFAADEELPALLGTIGVMDIHGNADVCGTYYTPSYMEIESKSSGQTQYFRGKLIGDNGMYLENLTASTSIFSSDAGSSSTGDWVAIAAHSGHNLVLNASGHVAAWGDQTNVPADLAHVAAISAGGSHNLALVVNTVPSFPAQPILEGPGLDTDGFHFFVPTRYGKVYAVEFSDSLSDGTWSAWPLFAGNSGTFLLKDSAATNSQRFYRVQQW